MDGDGVVERVSYELCVAGGGEGRAVPPGDLRRRRRPLGVTLKRPSAPEHVPSRQVDPDRAVGSSLRVSGLDGYLERLKGCPARPARTSKCP